MIAVEPTQDVEYLDRVMHDPAIALSLTDDRYPDPTQFSTGPIIKQKKSLFLKVLVDDKPAGWYWFLEQPDYTLEAHTALLPICRGRAALQAGHAAIDWVFKNTPCNCIKSFAWTDSPAVIWYAQRMGFIETGRGPYEVTRQGKHVDIVHFSYPRSLWEANRN